ncbi:Vacuolar protein sorting/targeting protein 10 [Talaromyces islandicus]|uniref:Vacuolar protein sorting/targeting protein 10 n=1 Tax=Talaromyces islandicus TaxID=28573 RepID=A0A0U1M155_TALIS|nr:Vacuolar protein sorting/targeting protein 10 [Talaromyces islandicus]
MLAESLPQLRFLSTNEQEIKNFHFFRAITASELSGPFDFGFWTGEILQYTHVDPALWHATAALGAMHRQFITDNSWSYSWHPEVDHHVRFVLLQFNKSIANLKKIFSKGPLNEHDKIIVLTLCILFTCLCSLQGKKSQAFMHISNGMKLIQEWAFLSKGGSRVAIDMLLLMFTQLDSQGHYIRRRLGLKPAEHIDKYCITLPSFPLQPFATCIQAYVELERIINQLIQLDARQTYTSSAPQLVVTKQKEDYVPVFNAWETRFKGYLATTTESIHENSITLLRIRQSFANTLFNHPSKGELGYDEFVDQYTMIVYLAERILESKSLLADYKERHVYSTEFQRRPGQLDFSLSVVIAEPLLFTAMHCRKPSLRHKALWLLKMYPRREGIFDGVLATKLVEDYIIFEEKSCRHSRTRIPAYMGDGAPLNKDLVMCTTTGRWICQNHRINIRMATVIIGGGIIGTSIAYHLSNSRFASKEAGVHVIDSSSQLYSGASGYAGGFLARDWFEPAVDELGALSFDLHRQLAEKHDGARKWGFMQGTAWSLDGDLPERRAEATRSREKDASANEGPGWLTTGPVESISDQGVAQVDPLRLCHFLHEATVSQGVTWHYPAQPIDVVSDPATLLIRSVKVLNSETQTEYSISCRNIVICAGPWTSLVYKSLFPSATPPAVSALAGYSLVLRSPRYSLEDEQDRYHGKSHAVFTTTDSRGGFSPEMFSRQGAEIYISGLNDSNLPLPTRAEGSKVMIDRRKIDRLKETAVRFMGKSAHRVNQDDLEVLREGLCFRPISVTGRPIISRVNDEDLGGRIKPDRSAVGRDIGGVFVATGHGPWGISHSLGTGQVVADLVDGVEPTADIIGLSM